MCMQMALHQYKNLCMVLIPLCKNNLNLPMCSSFFLPCAWLPPPFVHHVAMLATSLHCADFFVCFCRNQFCSPTINQISFSQSKGLFPFILLCRQEKYYWTGPLGSCINCTNKISGLCICWKLSQYDKYWLSLVHTYINIIWLNKNIFHPRV